MKKQNTKLNIGVLGSSGKMGLAIEQMLLANKNFIPLLAIGKTKSPLFHTTRSSLKKADQKLLKKIDVWIDFSSPEGFFELIKATEKEKTPVVSGTTGFSEKEFSEFKKIAKERNLFWASNMSPGLWAFRQALKSLKTLSHFDFSMEEIHHTQKKDKPSGTAKTLQADLEKVIQKKIETPISHRLGGVFGVHTIFAASPSEMITLQHQALNRTVFAEGALLAAKWLAQQRTGLYSMDDLFFTKGAKS